MKQLNCSVERNVKRIKPAKKRLSFCLSPFTFELFVNFGLYRTWSETTMLNIATAHANMFSLFIFRFLDSITNVSESKF